MIGMEVSIRINDCTLYSNIFFLRDPFYVSHGKKRLKAPFHMNRYVPFCTGVLVRFLGRYRMPVTGQLDEFVSANVSRASRARTLHRELTGLGGDVGPVLRAPVHVVVVVHLVELGGVGAAALDGRVDVAVPHQCFPDVGVAVRLGGAGDDAGVAEEGVGVQRGEELQGLLEVVDHLLRGDVVGVAGGVEGADAGAVFAPLVLPERLVVAPVVFPVYGHVVQEVVAVEVLEDLRDVLVLAGFVAELLVGSVAFVGPDGHDRSVWTGGCGGRWLFTRGRGRSSGPLGRWRGRCPRTASAAGDRRGS